MDFMVLSDRVLGLTAGSRTALRRGNTEPIPDAVGRRARCGPPASRYRR
ncbi:hypothetical protein [Streptomyces sp. NPDC056061]